MKSSARTYTYCLLFLIVPSIGAIGCVSEKIYSYETIRNEHRKGPEYNFHRNVRSDNLANAEPEKSIGLKEAVKISLANNPDKMMALARIRKAAAVTQKADSAFYPSISFYTEYLEGDAPSSYLFKKIDQRQLPPGTDFNDPEKLRNFESGVVARLNLFNGGSDYMSRRIAESGETISRIDLQEIENSLIASVIETYFDALSAKSNIGIAEQSVRTVKAQLEIMRARFRAGGVLKSDILSLEVRLAEAREERIVAQNRYFKAVASLAVLLGIDPSDPFTLTENQLDSRHFPEHYLGGLALALVQRPELRKIRQQVVQSRMAVDRARSSYLPRLNLEGKYYLDDENFEYELERENWTVGLFFEWDIFSGFSTQSEKLKAEADLNEILSADRKIALSVKLDVKNAYLNLESARARLKTANASAASAEESLELVKKQYDGGSVSITRYLQTELDRNRARAREAEAFYDRNKALANVGRAVGFWSTNRWSPRLPPIQKKP